MSAGAVRFPAPADEERLRPSAPDVRTEEREIHLVRASTLRAAEGSDNTYATVSWGVPEALRMVGWVLTLSLYGVVLWFTGLTIVQVLHSH